MFRTAAAWIDFATVTSTHSNKWQQLAPQLFSIKTVPAFAINQRALLLRTPHGNILWDCIANLDPATKTLITALGGISAIAISHPHYYTTMQTWAAAFDAPVYLHASDRKWVMRGSPAIQFWEGDALELFPSVTLLRLGTFCRRHGAALAGGRRRITGGDILQVTPGKDAVSFMWSYPNMLPLPARTVERISGLLEGKNLPVCTVPLRDKTSRQMRTRLCSGRARNILLVSGKARWVNFTSVISIIPKLQQIKEKLLCNISLKVSSTFKRDFPAT